MFVYIHVKESLLLNEVKTLLVITICGHHTSLLMYSKLLVQNFLYVNYVHFQETMILQFLSLYLKSVIKWVFIVNYCFTICH